MNTENAIAEIEESVVEMKLELVPVPAADVERAKAFYVDRLGFTLDVDVSPAQGVRVVQVSPPGSGCSIGFGTGPAAYDGVPGSLRALHLVVADIEAARAQLLGRGVAVGEVTDPDGNTLELQEMSWRTGKDY